MAPHKRIITLCFLILAFTGILWAQTSQPFYILDKNESGIIKDYKARDYIILNKNFTYTATSGKKFHARVDTTLTFTSVFIPNPVSGDTTTIADDGTIAPPGNTFISNPTQTFEGLASIRQIPQMNGSVSDTCYVVPTLWFMTVPLSGNLNGYYKWKDVSVNNIPLLEKDSLGVGHGNEYMLTRDKVRTFNFNPAIDLSYGNVSKEILIKQSNLSQATIMGVWGPKEEELDTNKFVFSLSARQNESVVFTKDEVFPSIESGKTALAYGNDTTRNLLYKSGSNLEVSKDKFHERSLRIGTYYRTNKPGNSIWGEPQEALISLGSNFDSTHLNDSSTFAPETNNLSGFKGFTPELLVFDQLLSPGDRNIFESYLAIKYGISMDRSYTSANGEMIWNYSANKAYNNRITGYGREDMMGLNQKMATTSYEEIPYFSEQNDSYDSGDMYNLSSRNRLLVVGCQPANIMNDGEYVMFGDNDQPLTIIRNDTLDGYCDSIMSRKWLLNSYMEPTSDTKQTLTWTNTGLTMGNNKFINTIYKPASQLSGYAVTQKALNGTDGYMAWTIVETQYGPVVAKFGTENPYLTENSHDYGYKITSDGHVHAIKRGLEDSIGSITVQTGQRVEFEKHGNIMYLRINGIRYRNTEITISDTADLNKEYYGAVIIENNKNEVTLTNFRHGGFVDTGSRVELSYIADRAKTFEKYKEGNCYLLIDRNGTGNINQDSVETYPCDEFDVNRSKIIFNNVFWNTNTNGDKDSKVAFTFGFSTPSEPSSINKADDSSIEEEKSIFEPILSVYYKNPHDLSTVTVKMLFEEPSPSIIMMYDMSGRLIFRTELPASKEIQTTDIKMPMSGFYVIKVISSSKQYSRKVISKF